jgi:hypothetical protein
LAIVVRLDDIAIFIDWFYFFFDRFMPFKYSYMFWVFRSKSLNFLKMFFKIEMFIIVSVGGDCSRDICGKE